MQSLIRKKVMKTHIKKLLISEGKRPENLWLHCRPCLTRLSSPPPTGGESGLNTNTQSLSYQYVYSFIYLWYKVSQQSKYL